MLLSLHTCGTTGSVALGRVDESGAEVRILAQAALTGRAYAAQLNPRISEMLAGQHASLRDIEAVVAVRGPGSFTGIRVGLGAAKGLAHARGIPLITLSQLELIAAVSGLPHVLATADAGRGDYYVGEYREGRQIMESLLNYAEVVALLHHPGRGVLVYEQVVEQKNEESAPVEHARLLESALAPYRPLYVQAPDAGDALRFALARWQARSFDDIAALDANYLRRPDAELFDRLAPRRNAAAQNGSSGI